MSKKIARNFDRLKQQFDDWDDWGLSKRDRELFYAFKSVSVLSTEYNNSIFDIFAKSYTIITNKYFKGSDIDCNFSHHTLMKIFDFAIKYANNIAFQ